MPAEKCARMSGWRCMYGCISCVNGNREHRMHMHIAVVCALKTKTKERRCRRKNASSMQTINAMLACVVWMVACVGCVGQCFFELCRWFDWFVGLAFFFFLSLLCVAGFFFCYLYAIPNSFTWVQLHMQQICWIIPFFCNLKQTNKKTHRFSLHWVLRIVGVIVGKRPWRILRSDRIDDDFRFSTLWCYFCLFITSWTIKF